MEEQRASRSQLPPAARDHCGGWNQSATIGLQLVPLQRRRPLQVTMERTRFRKKRNFWEQKIKVVIGEEDVNEDGLVAASRRVQKEPHDAVWRKIC